MADAQSVPDCLTIEEAARVLRMGRTTAYEQARVYRETDGKAGVLNFAVGACFRVPTAALERTLGRSVTRVPEPKRLWASGPESKPVERPLRVPDRGHGRPIRFRPPPLIGSACQRWEELSAPAVLAG
jgi:hypothetical protein